MVRPKKLRTVNKEFKITYFKPAGVLLADLKEIILAFEELEALRLADFKGLNQKKAAKKMKISRATFQRVLSKARLKTAQALSEGRAIKIKGGEFIMNPRGLGRGAGRGRGRGRMGGPFAAGPAGKCVCTNPDCKNEASHQAGVPCYQLKCSKCGSPMVRQT
jgi:uncharacterized protein